MAWWNVLIKPVSDVFCRALDIVDDFVPDKDLANKLKAALRQKIISLAHNEFMALLQGQVQIVTAEIQGKSWLQRNWRPLLMAEFGVIIFNNYILAPYVGLLFGAEFATQLEIPPDMWQLLKLGISGYVVGRSMEKVADGNGLKGMMQKVLNGMNQRGDDEDE